MGVWFRGEARYIFGIKLEHAYSREKEEVTHAYYSSFVKYLVFGIILEETSVMLVVNI